MFSNNNKTIKKYYEISSTSTTCDSTSTINAITLLFITKSNIILNYYNAGNLQNFNTEITSFNNLKLLYPTYNNDTQVKLIINFVNIIDTLYNSNIDLINQKTILENELLVIHNTLYHINTDSYNLTQNTKLDVVYLQYLLMYDLQETNGVFIPSKLEIAKQVLISNDYILINLRS